ncbi:MAG: GNAT family N-acetyltransferase [Thermoflexaceae bacterium]|nr:GNAT family N-acetyltransferase [Thermoflexaceae bacterium]
MISFAGKEDVSALKKLWKEAFSEEAFAGIFYDMIFYSGMSEEVKILVDRQVNNGKESESEIISMLHYIPCCYENGNTKCNGAYLYALATDRRYRGRGIMGEMIEYAKQMADEQKKDFLYLIPAEDSLYGYYEKFGFETLYTGKRQEDLFLSILPSDTVCRRRLSNKQVLESALKKWKISDVTLMFHRKLTEYTVQELVSEKDFEGYGIVEDGRLEGYYIACGGKIAAYGMSGDTFLKENNFQYEKSGSIYWVGPKKDITEIRGYIPY